MSPLNKKLSVVHVTDSFHPEIGGVERVIMNLALQQIQAGHKVSVLSKGLQGQADRESYRGIEIFRYPHDPRPTPRNYATSFFGSANTFKTIMVERAPDIAHCHLTLASQGIIGIVAKSGIGMVATFYGPWDREFKAEAEQLLGTANYAYKAYLELQMATQRSLQKRLLRQASRVILLSDYSAEQALEIAPSIKDKRVKIPGGVQTGVFKPMQPSGGFRAAVDVPEEAFMVLTVRRLVERMGVDLLIEAVKICGEKGHDVYLVVGGRGRLRDKLEKKAKSLGVGNRIRLAGFIPDEQLPVAYTDADMFALPTRAQENFGLPILEAAACGIPVIGTPVGSIPEVLGLFDENLIAEAVSGQALAEKIILVANDIDAMKERFKQHSELVHENYNWETISRRVDEVYAEVL